MFKLTQQANGKKEGERLRDLYSILEKRTLEHRARPESQWRSLALNLELKPGWAFLPGPWAVRR